MSSILFESADQHVVVIDIPKSIEEAQELHATHDGQDKPSEDGLSKRRRQRHLVSAPAPSKPFAAPSGQIGTSHDASQSLASQLAELTTKAAVEDALYQLKCANFDGPWCLPRFTLQAPPSRDVSLSFGNENGDALIPPGAQFLNGTIADLRDEFVANAPQFDLIVLDPPWPNRSARRRRQGRTRRNSALETGNGADHGYATAQDMGALSDMLKQIPAGSKLAEGGLVAVWVTNKASCEALLTDTKHGVFRDWGVELVATWTWLKVTAHGEPVVAVDSGWRRPWERLLLARRLGSGTATCASRKVKALPSHRVIVGVPDVHSRKPHLGQLLAPFLEPACSNSLVADTCRGLEVFARNLTAGWWSWGNEVLLFQHPSWWLVDTDESEVVSEGNAQVPSS
ncbi:hypothetical protein SEPCBS119000_003292 [Sporothrix epigloea]|uniref:MT-A70-domain-containing protein n=1 Tax=Sporothrix epigloea TaxID=1892477 RepID=A0ABP0DPH4_9PEZI